MSQEPEATPWRKGLSKALKDANTTPAFACLVPVLEHEAAAFTRVCTREAAVTSGADPEQAPTEPSRLDQAEADGVAGDLDAVVHAELLENVAAMK